MMVPLSRPKVQENKRKEIWTELGGQWPQMKKKDWNECQRKEQYNSKKNEGPSVYVFFSKSII